MSSNAAAIRAFIQGMPIADTLGLQIGELTADRTVVRLPITPSLTFDGVTCQGGIVATLADFAAVAAAGAAARAGQAVATTGCETHNLAPARGSQLVAVGRLLSRPGRTMVAAADVFVDDEAGERCLTGLFTAATVG